MKDATGREIIIGKRYGYSQQSNGIVSIVTGFVEKIKDLKATLGSIQVKWGAYGKTGELKEETRRRSVNICHLFPVEDFIIGDEVLTEMYDNEVFKVIGVLEDNLLLRGDWSGGTHCTVGDSHYEKTKCKLK